MNCYKCGKEMALQKEDIANNFKKGKRYKEYKRMIYWCKKDDIWVTFEIPADIHAKVSANIPDDLLIQLRAQTGLITLWDKLNPSTKKKYLKYVSDAKEVTRSMRIEKIVKKMLDHQ